MNICTTLEFCKVYFQPNHNSANMSLKIEFWKKREKKMKCDKKLKKSFSLNEHNIQWMWKKYDVIPITLVFRVAN